MKFLASSVTPTSPESIKQFPEFYAFRPEWLTAQEQKQFKLDYPELVAKYADCWQVESELEAAQA